MNLLLFGRWRTEQPGGPDAVVLNLARAFRQAGHAVTIWTPRRSVRRVSSRAAEVPVVDLPSYGLWPILPAATGRFLRGESGAFDFAFFFSVFTPFNVLAARALRCPYASAPLGGYARESIKARGRLRKRLALALGERAFLQRAAFINVWSREEQGDVERICQPRRCVVTPPGFEGAALPERRPRPVQPGRRVLFLGRFAVRHKGLDLLVSAFSEAARAEDRLTLAGADFRGGLAELHQLQAASARASQISFHGVAFGATKHDLFQETEIFVHFSRWEGTPLVVVEALASGVPVLISPETNLGDLVLRYRAGWVVEQGDYAGAMRRALSATPAELDEMGCNARRLVAAEFRWDRAASVLLQAITEEQAPPSGAPPA